ncbi:hypothetical protein FLX56_11975 [Synechococcus moorigangaii CMS01]|nr:hypothetical protein [Synechococcus moorigangaii CMS01]
MAHELNLLAVGLILGLALLVSAAILQAIARWLANKMGVSILAPLPWLLSMLGMWLVLYFGEVVNADTLNSDPLGVIAASAVSKLDEILMILLVAVVGYLFAWREQRTSLPSESKTDD